MNSRDTGPSARQQLVELLAGYPEAEFLGAAQDPHPWPWLDPALRSSFASQLPGLLAGWNTTQDRVALLRAVNALGWELECVQQALADGEILSTTARKLEIKDGARCPRYDDKQPLEEPPRVWADKVKVQNDVPVLRSTSRGPLPYVVEAKCSQSRPYGQAYGFGKNAKNWIRADALNQLLRYQFAIEQGRIAGATVELKGAVHPRVLDWMLDGLDGQGTRIGDVEVVWSLPLPSGAHTRVWLKKGQGEGRLKEEAVVLDSDRPALAAFQHIREDRNELKRWLRGAVPLDWPLLPEVFKEQRLNPYGNKVSIVDEPWVLTDVNEVRAFLNVQRAWVASLPSEGWEPGPVPLATARSPMKPG